MVRMVVKNLAKVFEMVSGNVEAANSANAETARNMRTPN
jgi:hypothetical protein